MNRKFKTTLIAAVAAAGVALSGAAFAHTDGGGKSSGPGWGRHNMGGHGFRGPMGGHRMRGRWGRRGFGQKPLISLALRFRDELKLSDEQAEKLEKLRAGFVRRMITERAAVRTLRFDIRQALKADKTDLANVEKLIRSISKKRGDIALDRIRTIEKGKALLTKEQAKSLKTLVRQSWRGGHAPFGEMMERMRKHHGSEEGHDEGPEKPAPSRGKKF